MQKKYKIGVALLALGLLVFYIWYGHASIYWKLGAAGLSAPSDIHAYTIGTASANTLTYAAIGDSLTAGVGVDSYTQSYPYDIAKQLASSTDAQVYLEPFAVPGVRTQYVIDHFLNPVLASKPDIVTLLIGINDIHGNIPNAVFKAHYEEILQKLTNDTQAKIYVINLPYIGTPNLIDSLYRAFFTYRTQQYNTIIKALASQYHVTYIDLYTAHLPHELNDAYYARDYFHQNALGYTLWSQAIYADFHQ